MGFQYSLLMTFVKTEGARILRGSPRVKPFLVHLLIVHFKIQTSNFVFPKEI